MPAFDSPTLRLYGIGAFVSLSSLCFGFDTGSVGSITLMPQFADTFGHLTEIKRGAFVASMLASSAMSGFVAGTIADRISRKYTIAIGALIFAIGEAICIGAPVLSALIVGRIIAGVGEGFFLTISATYLSELSPTKQRGRLMSLIQIAICTGITLGYFTCYATAEVPGSAAYRAPFAIQTALSLIVAAGAPFLPYSPRYLINKGRLDEARQVLDRLNKAGAEQEKEEILSQGRDVHKSSFARIFKKDVLATTLWSAWIQAAQQLSGIDFVLFYAPLLFRAAGLTGSTASFVASGVSGLVLLVTSLIAAPFMDRIGRKSAIVGGGLVVGGSLITIGLLYASGATDYPAGRWTVIALIEVFIIAFSLTWALHIRIYCTEIHYGYVRAAASSFGGAVNQATNFLVALTAPAFLAASKSGPYFTFGSVTLLTAIMCMFVMTETRGLSLEAIGLQSGSQSPLARLLSHIKRKAEPSHIPLESPAISIASQSTTATGYPPSSSARFDFSPHLQSVALTERRPSRVTAERPALQALTPGEGDSSHSLSSVRLGLV